MSASREHQILRTLAMTSDSFTIDPDITRAETLPAPVYASPQWYARLTERV